MQHRTEKNARGDKCWTQDQIHWACAGNAANAQSGLIGRFSVASPLCRFPLYGSEGPDSCPDFDHFGSGSTALQRMLVQEAGDKIQLLPAWPANWDADFKLHVAGQTTITGKVAGGLLAFHRAYWHNNFGTPMSNGSINMRIWDAKWLFEWAGPTWSG